MALIYSDPTFAKLVTETAAKVGQSTALQQEAEQRQKMDLAGMEIKSRRELAQFEADMRTQAAKLSQAWELEKMQRQSELEFQMAQKGQALKHDTMLQKEVEANEKFLQYQQDIQADKTKTPKEKQQFIDMARDQIKYGLQTAWELYFPEQSAASRGKDISMFGGTPTSNVTPTAPTAPSTPAGTSPEIAEAVKVVQSTMPTADRDTQNKQVRALATKAVEQRIADSISNQSGGSRRADDPGVQDEAKKLAAVEMQVQSGLEDSRHFYRPGPTLSGWWQDVNESLNKIFADKPYVEESQASLYKKAQITPGVTSVVQDARDAQKRAAAARHVGLSE